MKHIAKHTLLFGAFAMLLSTMPMQAMESASPEVQQEVATKQGFFGRWTDRAKNLRMKNLIRELNRAWKPFIACVEKGKEDCGKRAKVVRNIITSILALVAVVGITAAGVAIKRRLGQGAPASTSTPLVQAVKDYISRGLPAEQALANIVNAAGAEYIPLNRLASAKRLFKQAKKTEDPYYKRIEALIEAKGMSLTPSELGQ